MTEPLRLHTVLVPRGPAGAVVLSEEQVHALGGGAKAFPVTVTVNGCAIALRLARMGGEPLIGFSKAARAQAGVEIGDEVDVEIVADTAPRVVEVPPDLEAALAADPEAAVAFEALAYSHRKEYVRWVSEAKREQTRADRIAQTVDRVRSGRTR
ncbi:MAG: DUF1905 domain-containing protein [Kineosporiaceae bacterium]|nr:DUF1905 domain-containing protein [Kineosporiaceae bacterium]